MEVVQESVELDMEGLTILVTFVREPYLESIASLALQIDPAWSYYCFKDLQCAMVFIELVNQFSLERGHVWKDIACPVSLNKQQISLDSEFWLITLSNPFSPTWLLMFLNSLTLSKVAF